MAQGPIGPTGPQGAEGHVGATGPEGPQGPRGVPTLLTNLGTLLFGMVVASVSILVLNIGAGDETQSLTPEQRALLLLTPPQWTGTPPSPQPVMAHVDFSKFQIDHLEADHKQLPALLHAQHGPACEGPPSTHDVTSYADAVYVCNNHVMTSMHSPAYGEIKMTPNRVLNFASGATVQWDMSTEIMSARDWVDVMISPFADNVAYNDDRDGNHNIGPKTGIQLRQEGGFFLKRWDNFTPSFLTNCCHPIIGDGVLPGTNQSAVRQTFRLTLSPTHAKLERVLSNTAPALVFFDVDLSPPLSWTQGVVSFSQHSYTPTKTCDDGGTGPCTPATWHWDEMQLEPSTEFSLIKADRRYVCSGSGGGLGSTACTDSQFNEVTFEAPAPANAFVRYTMSGTGNSEVSFNNGVSWVSPRTTDNAPVAIGEFPHSIMQSIPTGTTKVKIRFTGACTPITCVARDFSIWSTSGGVVLPTPTPPNSTATPLPSTLTPAATSTSTATLSTPTPISTSTPVLVATASATPVAPLPSSTTVPSTSTPTPLPPTATLIPPTATPTRTRTPTPLPGSTATPVMPTRQCTIRWGNNSLINLGLKTEAECRALGGG